MTDSSSVDVMSPSLERSLVDRARGGDQEAMGLLYDAYLPRLYRYCLSRVRNETDAEDLAEEIFLKVLGAIDGFEWKPVGPDQRIPFGAWLFRIAHNVVANWYRDRQRNKTLPMDDALAAAEDDRDPLERVEDAAQLRKAMARLPADRQQLLLLKFAQELSHAEIGKIMGRTEGAVKALLHRTLKALKDDLQGAEHDGHEGH